MTRLGACSWSLQPASPAELVEKLRAVALDTVQLALDPIRSGAWPEDLTVATLAEAGIGIASGMMAFASEDYTSLETIRETGGVVPDAAWPENLEVARADAALARRLGLSLVTFHAGFIPHDEEDPRRELILDRLRQVVDVFAAADVTLGLETGQETAATLRDALAALDRPTLGINFDPANMILYAMGDPVAALDLLAPRVLQIHVKDALRTERPGQWGEEVRVGTGDVDWAAFFATLVRRGLDCDLMVEREAGDARLEDIRGAVALVREHGSRS